MQSRHPFDLLIIAADRALRAIYAPAHASRPIPERAPAPAASASPPRPDRQSPRSGSAASEPDTPTSAPPAEQSPALSQTQRREAAALMRVNHAGELAAQALYHGQSLVARTNETRALLLRAAREESDHLAWCETRLRELGSRPSLLNPLWYGGSVLIGALAALLGDRVSLGFVQETERQVEGHLDVHLSRLPSGDTRSRAILETMRTDEIAHGMAARAAGAAELPDLVRALMRRTARVMTATAYWL